MPRLQYRARNPRGPRAQHPFINECLSEIIISISSLELRRQLTTRALELVDMYGPGIDDNQLVEFLVACRVIEPRQLEFNFRGGFNGSGELDHKSV